MREQELKELNEQLNKQDELVSETFILFDKLKEQLNDNFRLLIKDLLDCNADIHYDLTTKLGDETYTWRNHDNIRIRLSKEEDINNNYDFDLYIYDNHIEINNGCIGNFDANSCYLNALRLIVKLFDHQGALVLFAKGAEEARNAMNNYYKQVDEYRSIERNINDLKDEIERTQIEDSIKEGNTYELMFDRCGRNYLRDSRHFTDTFKIIRITEKTIKVEQQWINNGHLYYTENANIKKNDFINYLMNNTIKEVK